MTARIVIDQIVDAAAARVTVTRDAAGVLAAAFDLGGLPRVDAYLVGRPVTEVPGLVEHLCGICPAAHHLAGIRALESLAKVAAVPPTAEAIRRLLHYAGVIAVHVVGFVAEHRDAALTLRRFAKAAMAAAGSPGHFPATAVPGGVAAPVTPAARDQCAALLAAARAAAVGIARQALAQSPPPDGFAGADVALVSPAGFLDLFGFSVRAVAADGTVVTTARPGEWDDVVAESEPGSAAPRPYLRALGAGT
ncbi:MAG: nickel-dependent hydrogenase large subunit, partial [Propionibacteriaceae bacterium]|nr:nickel-dependent hydrogenase large subunit [Propionibacteriaceae bacterium]